jgi:cell division inhibitor SepF
MGSAMRKMGVYLGLLEDTDRYDEEYYDEYDERTQRAPVEEPARTAAVANISERRRPSAPAPHAVRPPRSRHSRRLPSPICRSAAVRPRRRPRWASPSSR